MSMLELELGIEGSGAPAPPVPAPRVAPVMCEGDVVILEQNGDKWGFVSLKHHQ
jgi:hypothetical protein